MNPIELSLDRSGSIHTVNEGVDGEQSKHRGYQLGIRIRDARELDLQSSQSGKDENDNRRDEALQYAKQP